MTLVDRLEEVAAGRPEAILIRPETGADLTYADVVRRVGRIAGGLHAHGVGPGDRVALMAGSTSDFVAAVFATWRLGAILVAFHGQLTVEEARHQLENSGARVAVGDGERSHEVLTAAAAGLSRRCAVVDLGGLDGEPPPSRRVAEGDDATIFYTSGTTGVPKGATHTHRALRLQLEAVQRRYSAGADDQLLSILPLHLLSILILGPLLAVHTGATMRLMSRYDPVAFAGFVKADRTTMVCATIPMLFIDLLELPAEHAAGVDLGSIRVAGCGGSPMPADVRRAFEERYDFRFVHAYGGTEGPAVVTTDPLDRERRFESVGIALDSIQVTVVDDGDNALRAGEVGEICTSAHATGPWAGAYEPVRCYWGMPEATAEALRGGRLHWGDIGSLDADGFLTLLDRKKDLIIRGGMNVYPRELERLLDADPRIAECAVVAAPHPRYDEVPVAFVRLAPGADMDEAQVRALVADHAARYKHLDAVHMVSEFPRNTLGKILKRELRARLAAAQAGAGNAHR